MVHVLLETTFVLAPSHRALVRADLPRLCW
jgi:hypothetical protein